MQHYTSSKLNWCDNFIVKWRFLSVKVQLRRAFSMSIVTLSSVKDSLQRWSFEDLKVPTVTPQKWPRIFFSNSTVTSSHSSWKYQKKYHFHIWHFTIFVSKKMYWNSLILSFDHFWRKNSNVTFFRIFIHYALKISKKSLIYIFAKFNLNFLP